ncbi:MAG: glycoside hydrolase family 32 protein [Thermotogota bacterium]
MIGWLNDPNGLIEYKNQYHLFYQFNPHGPTWGKMHWGHAVSKDLFHWMHLPVALYPDQPFSKEDDSGIFSGSAIEKDDQLLLMYTQYYDPNIFPDRLKEEQCIAFSEDGVNFEKYTGNPVIATPPNPSVHDYRDPKVFKMNDKQYYCVIGSGENGVGKILLYRSKDLYHWDYESVLCEFDPRRFGPVIECPDFFQLVGKWVLLFSAGFTTNGTRRNYYAVGDFRDNQFVPDCIEPMDLANDLYATQTFQDKADRRIAIGWLHTPERQNYTVKEGWAGIMGLPKKLDLKENKLIQQPVDEFHTLIEAAPFHLKGQESVKSIDIANLENCLFFTYKPEKKDFLIVFISGEDELILDQSMDYFEITELRNGMIELKEEYAMKNPVDKMDVYLDKSSIELIFNNGEKVGSFRIYPRDVYTDLRITPLKKDGFFLYRVYPSFNCLL